MAFSALQANKKYLFPVIYLYPTSYTGPLRTNKEIIILLDNKRRPFSVQLHQ